MTNDATTPQGPLARGARALLSILVWVNTWLERLFMTVATLLFAVFICSIIYQVFARSILAWSVRWTDEVAVMCFIWSIFLGAAVALRRGMHYVIDVVSPNWVNTTNALRLFGSLACIPLIYVLVIHGQTFANLGWRQTSIALEMPLFYIRVAMPIAGAAMVLFLVEVLVEDVQRLISGRPAPVQLEDL